MTPWQLNYKPWERQVLGETSLYDHEKMYHVIEQNDVPRQAVWDIFFRVVWILWELNFKSYQDKWIEVNWFSEAVSGEYIDHIAVI